MPRPPGAAQGQDALSSATVPLAIPSMLFSIDIRRWRYLAGKSLLALALAVDPTLYLAVHTASSAPGSPRNGPNSPSSRPRPAAAIPVAMAAH